METSPKPKTWIALGSISVVALIAYNLGRMSVANDNRLQSHQDAGSEGDPDLRSAVSATQKRLASCEKTLQRRDPHLQKREKEPYANEDNPTPPPEPKLPKQCIIAMQAKEQNMAAANCRDFRTHFDAYKAILGSNSIGCESVLSIRDLARMQYQICILIINVNEEISEQYATNGPIAIDAVEDAYATKSKHGDVDGIDALVKNPECIARMQTR
ncbi:hypothetical protein [Sorangium atrum]|uniref:Secreted protein n=1 Tax=Sorangium atrum TaxID=2995308 RepID=A0ABT5C5L7_9BACT|nr:hypothetical protein [Sorangium aterium]MDC0681720.1 hypothetical protein [Sorangium aterium]